MGKGEGEDNGRQEKVVAEGRGEEIYMEKRKRKR